MNMRWKMGIGIFVFCVVLSVVSGTIVDWYLGYPFVFTEYFVVGAILGLVFDFLIFVGDPE